MDRISQHQHQGPGPARGHYPTQHASTIGNDREDALAKAKTIGELVAPVFSFPFTATYTSELEISDFEDTCGNIAEMTIEATGQNQIQSSHVTAARSWDQPSHIQHGKHSSQDQPAFAAWEYQAPVDEPFNHVGEVVFEPAGGRQGEGYGGEFRCRKRQKRGGF
jgi:hypothetical protein